jgi:copper chaperone
MERIVLAVKGMTCDHCVTSVTEALKRVPGVKLAKVSLVGESAEVTYDSRQTSLDALKAAVKAAGYELG